MKSPKRGTPDFVLLFLTIALVCFGYAMVFSASSVAFPKQGPWHLSKRNAVYITLGIVSMLTLMNIHFSKFKKWAKPSFIFSLFLLFMLPFFGTEHNGARSWYEFGPLNLQPTEMAKLSLIMYLAFLVSKKGKKMRDLATGLGPSLVLVVIVSALIMIQPDFGSTVILILSSLVVIVAGGASWKHLIGGGAALGFVGLFFITGHRMDRITSYLNPWSDPQGTGYHLIQSFYAFAHGGWFGAGFGQGIQKLNYLPMAYNDFIFAIIGEELGFIGCSIFLFFFIWLLWRGIIVSLRCQDTFGQLLGIGVVGMLGIQAFVNIGGVTGAIPMTGVTLPFVSYGGTSMIVCLISMGILLSISREQSRLEAKQSSNSNKKAAAEIST